MKIRLLTDTASDFDNEYLKEQGIEEVEISVYFEDEKFDQNQQKYKDFFYKKLTSVETFPTTSQPSPSDFVKYFSEARDQREILIAILISSELSGTYQAANIAKEMVDYEHIHIVDSKTASIGQMILVEYANQSIKNGKPVEEILKGLNELRENIVLCAIVDNLEYLHKGGRLSKTKKVVSNLLNIKPILELKSPGEIVLSGKAIHLNGAINKLIKMIENEKIDENFSLYMFYTYRKDGLLRIKKKLNDNKLITVQMGSTIGAHVGPEAYGIAYVKKSQD